MMRLLLFGTIVALASTAQARPGPHLRVEAITTAPIHIGANVIGELPGGFRLSSAIGVLPRFYVDGINEIAEATGAYDEQVGQVIEDSLASSLVWRTHVGWRPIAGLYLEGGFGLVTLGGGASEAQVIALAFGIDTPFDPRARYEVDVSLFMLDLEVGYEFWVADRLSIRLGAGAATTVGASASVERQGREELLGMIFARIAEAELEDIAERYVHTPTLTVAVGWRLF